MTRMTRMTRTLLPLIGVAILAAATPLAGEATRVKDLTNLIGVRPTPLIGYGLVVGLNKTGDRRQTLFSTQSLANMLRRFGVVVAADQMRVENVAAVMVTTELPPFIQAGGRIDVTVSSVGDARSLQGGTLIATPLRGPDGAVYGMAQGPLSIGGFGAGNDANSVSVNHLTVGRVPGGALIDTAPTLEFSTGDTVTFSLRSPDFMTATRLARVINTELGGKQARAIDPGTVTVQVPDGYLGAIPDLMARLEPLDVDVDNPARVVVNERTGTVVVGAGVRLGPAAVAHGNLSISIATQFAVSQPAPFSRGGQTVTVPQQEVQVEEQDARLVELEEGSTLQDVVRALNMLGATPRDIIAIMQALKAVGALHAELVII